MGTKGPHGILPSNVSVAIYALELLGGKFQFVHTEDIALKCFELLPDRFSWRKYPQHPDAEPARSALFDAAKEKYGCLVTGDNRMKGWKLTQNGVEYANRVAAEVEMLVGKHGRRANVDRRGLGDVENHPAYIEYLSSRRVDHLQFHELTTMLRCPVDAPAALVRERFDSLMRRASDAGRDDIAGFLQAAVRKYQSELGQS
jgi:hypothetical protein